MTKIEFVLEELKYLKQKLSHSVNRVWSLRMALSEAHRQGHRATDFLPRRLEDLRQKEEINFKSLVTQVNSILTTQLNKPFFVLHSDQDLRAWLKIRKIIRYIRNSFTNDYPVAHTLVKLNKALQSASLR